MFTSFNHAFPLRLQDRENPSPGFRVDASRLTQGHLPSVATKRGEKSRLALIIDDLGYRRRDGERAIALPGQVTFSFLPDTPHALHLATLAQRNGREILLHLPMESIGGQALGPGGLTQGMTREQIIRTVHADLASLPHVAGVSNHMGSLLTREAEPMKWLMQALKLRPGLYFLDSRTTSETVAEHMAASEGVPHLKRDVFLDNTPRRDEIARQFERLVSISKRQGYAVGIGHPHAETLEMLERLLPTLAARGVHLVPVSQLVHRNWRQQSWQLSLSPSPRDVKSSKPSPSSTCCAEPESPLSPPVSMPVR